MILTSTITTIPILTEIFTIDNKMGKKTFLRIVDHIFPIRKKFLEDFDEVFDYPDYGGLPKKISNSLSPEAVDAMQYILDGCKFSSKRDFARAYRNRLLEIGERGIY